MDSSIITVDPCQYLGRLCLLPRAIKANGKPHKLCEIHRERARLYQQKSVQSRRAREAIKLAVCERDGWTPLGDFWIVQDATRDEVLDEAVEQLDHLGGEPSPRASPSEASVIANDSIEDDTAWLLRMLESMSDDEFMAIIHNAAPPAYD